MEVGFGETVNRGLFIHVGVTEYCRDCDNNRGAVPVRFPLVVQPGDHDVGPVLKLNPGKEDHETPVPGRPEAPFQAIIRSPVDPAYELFFTGRVYLDLKFCGVVNRKKRGELTIGPTRSNPVGR